MPRKPAATLFSVRVDYEEFKPESYRGVVLEKVVKGLAVEVLRINSGDFGKDFAELEGKLPSITKGRRVVSTSSVEHYRQDIAAKDFEGK